MEKIAIMLLKIIAQALAAAAGKKLADTLGVEVLCAVSKGCPERLEKIAVKAAERQS